MSSFIINPYRFALIGTTWNPSDKGANVTLSSGDLVGSLSPAVSGAVRSIKGHSSGKLYAEIKNLTTVQESLTVGIANSTMSLAAYVGGDANGWSILADGRKFNSASATAYGNASVTNTIVAIALDIAAGKVWFGPAGVWGGGGDPAAGTGAAFTGLAAGTYYLAAGASSSVAESWQLNAGSSAFAYTPPSGFSAWGS